MCGIAGQVAQNGGEADPALVRAMAERLSHRGPDGEGDFFSGPVGLAHRRLAIIDLSDEGRQPMANEDGSLQIVFNGEIYNYPALREELIAAGHNFATTTDTEVRSAPRTLLRPGPPGCQAVLLHHGRGIVPLCLGDQGAPCAPRGREEAKRPDASCVSCLGGRGPYR